MSRVGKPVCLKNVFGVFSFVVFIMVCSLDVADCPAVNSKITRLNSGADFLKGKIENCVISSKGQIKLGLSAETIAEKFEDVNEPWSVNCIVVSGQTVYFGTSPNGGIYQYSFGKLTRIYPAEGEIKGKKEGGFANPLGGLFKQESSKRISADTNDAKLVLRSEADSQSSKEKKAETYKADSYLSNLHIFAMAADVSGQLLAAVSGKECKLLRLRPGGFETVYEPNDAKYIFAVTLDKKGNIYLGTGPKGKVFMLDPFGKNPQLVYQARDKNILSLAVDDKGFVYAGSDERGLVYKIDVKKKSASILYDSEQQEIPAMILTANGDIYAAGTSAKVVAAQERFASLPPLGGRPEVKAEKSEGADNIRVLQIANTKKEAEESRPARPAPSVREGRGQGISYIYKIDEAGYSSEEFSESAVFFCLAQQEGKILLGSGNEAQLFSIDPQSQQQAIVYEDKQSTQITAIAATDKDIYIGTANPAKLIRLKNTFADEGIYNSDLVDAGQPARWGKLQIEADIPAGCKVNVAARSGNVKDVNDPTFSMWSKPVEITDPVQLDCPVGRFCQFKLILRSSDGLKSPVVREVSLASSIPNLAPVVEVVNVGKVAGKEGIYKIDYKTKDENDDKLIYKIDFRKVGRTSWIEIKNEVETPSFEWDSKTVEDGRYEIRVTASDERSNTAETRLTDSRVSDPVVVDNTAPSIEKADIKVAGDKITMKLSIVDLLSVIGHVQYTVDSNSDWIGTLPDDLVYDTTKEDFTIIIEKQKAGDHVIAIKVSDDVGNTAYKTYDVTVGGK
jgi:hypothetical protein